MIHRPSFPPGDESVAGGPLSNGPGCDIIRHATRPPSAVDGHRVVEREDSMLVRLGLVTVLAALVAASSPAEAQVLSEKNISIKMALLIAETALTQCTPRVSVAVLDRAGRLRVFLQ